MGAESRNFHPPLLLITKVDRLDVDFALDMKFLKGGVIPS
jgi:hypothetical protein